jgi:hypothetical protein
MQFWSITGRLLAPTQGMGRDSSATSRPRAAATVDAIDACAAPTCATGSTAAPLAVGLHNHIASS